MRKQLDIQIVDHLEGMREIHSQWNGLLSDSRANTVFLTWEWIFTWAELFVGTDRRLFVLLIKEGEEIVGIAPWVKRRARNGIFPLETIEFLAAHEMGSDYLDVIVRHGRENDVASCIYDFLFKKERSQWDCLYLSDIPANSFFLLHFLNLFEKNGKYIKHDNGSFCPYIPLPSNPEDLPGLLSANRRQTIKRHEKLLGKYGVIDHHTSDDIGNLERFLVLYRQRWDKADNRFSTFLEKIIDRTRRKGVVQFDFLAVKDRDIATTVHLNYDNKQFMYLMAVDVNFDPKISVGNILLNKCIRSAIENRYIIYDFLKGDELYKFSWAKQGNRLMKIKYYNNRPGPVTSYMHESIKNLGKIVIR